MDQISEELKEFFQVLGLTVSEHLPKLKEVKKAYYDRSKEIHPDKHMNEEEEEKKLFQEKFKRLHTAYTTISKFIIKNSTVIEDDEEESWARKEFENANVMTMNERSVTLSIPKEHTKAWINVFVKILGDPSIEHHPVMEFSLKLNLEQA